MHVSLHALSVLTSTTCLKNSGQVQAYRVRIGLAMVQFILPPDSMDNYSTVTDLARLRG